MKILIVTPAPPSSKTGNRVTALRWAWFLRALGHQVAVREKYEGQRSDLLIALHARKSFTSIQRFCAKQPGRPVIVALTGTDLYNDIHHNRNAQRALQWADRLIVLQPLGIAQLAESLQSKTRVIYQSVPSPKPRTKPSPRTFGVCLLGHLRPVKDPFRAAKAGRLLPAESRIRIVHVGGALTASMERAARAEAAKNPRYQWLGEVPRAKALHIMARSRLLVLSSMMEGGANAICEALAYSVPIVSSRISGSIGLLGPDYPGYFPVGDTRALADLLIRAERDAVFYRALISACRQRRHLVEPRREKASWRRLLAELASEGYA